MREAIWGERFLEGLRLYDALEKAGPAPSGQASYLAGWAHWKLHEPEQARPLLEKAARTGFRAANGRVQPEDLIAEIDEFEAAKPPAVEVPGLDRSLIDPYADEKTLLTVPVLDALPRIAAIGGDIYGKPPPVRFFLLARKPALGRLYRALQMKETPHSTGVVNMVIYCEEKAHRATESETVSLALHESVHAWAAGYLRTRYDRAIQLPPYIDEGLAVYVASLWSDDVRALTPARLAVWRRHHRAPPPFETLTSPERFRDPSTNAVDYWLADLLIERLLGPPSSGAVKIPALLDAYARTGDGARAWREVTGKDVRTEYDALVSEAWR